MFNKLERYLPIAVFLSYFIKVLIKSPTAQDVAIIFILGLLIVALEFLNKVKLKLTNEIEEIKKIAKDNNETIETLKTKINNINLSKLMK